MPAGLARDSAGWEAELQLGFTRRGVRTVLGERRHRGPLTVQRPFYPEGHVCHAYVLHPPGGVVGGDSLSIQVRVAQQAHALITTPASTKFYRSANATAVQAQQLHVAQDGVLEWLPQDTILFDACRVSTGTIVQLSGNAKFAGWEIICLGRPASGESFAQGECRQRLEIYRDGQPLLIERTHLSGNSVMQSAKWGLANYPVFGTMLVSGANQAMLGLAREVIHATDVLFSVTLVQDVLVCRYLGNQGMEAREQFTRVWEKIRPTWIGLAPCAPRIWQT